MAVLLDKRSAFSNTAKLRLSIQTDLSGFSFVVHDTSLSEIVHYSKCDYPLEISSIEDTEHYLSKEIKDNEIICGDFGEGVSLYHDTEKYTLIPSEYFRKEDLTEELKKLYPIDEFDEIYSIDLPSYNAVLAYVLPNSITSPIYLSQKKSRFFPLSLPLLNELGTIKEHNKLLVYYKRGIVHIIAAKGDELLLCNAFPAKDFNTAIYFIFLVVKEVIFNPELTVLNLFGSICYNDYKSISGYFKEIRRRELSEIL